LVASRTIGRDQGSQPCRKVPARAEMEAAAMKKAILVPLIVLATSLLVVSASQAANVSFVGNDGNVYRTSPDGTLTQKVTSDATAENRYVTPSQKNDGTIVAIRKV